MGGTYAADSWENRLHASGVQALYLHIPFCVRKCAYCDFSSWATARDDEVLGRYVGALCAQLREAHELGLLDGCRTAYLGGGTPTMLGPHLLERLVARARSVAPQICELTVEANPDSLDDTVLMALVDGGATRISVGVQSLQDEELVALGRLHDAQTACERVAAAVASGLDVSMDLMCATPGQTDASWQSTLRHAIDLGVSHLSVYPLQIEEGTPLAQALGDDGPELNDPIVQAARMEQAEAMLVPAGLSRYEVASYARPGKECLHNQAYWTGRPYLGLGTSASSLLTREAYEVLRSIWSSLPKPQDDTTRLRLTVTSGRQQLIENLHLAALHGEVELLNEQQAAAEDLMLGMRRSCGIDQALVARAQHSLGAERVESALSRCVQRGLAAPVGDQIVPTHEGWLLGNELYGMLWDLAEGSICTIQV